MLVRLLLPLPLLLLLLLLLLMLWLLRRLLRVRNEAILLPEATTRRRLLVRSFCGEGSLLLLPPNATFCSIGGEEEEMRWMDWRRDGWRDRTDDNPCFCLSSDTTLLLTCGEAGCDGTTLSLSDCNRCSSWLGTTAFCSHSNRKTVSLHRSTSHHSPFFSSAALRSLVPNVTTSPWYKRQLVLRNAIPLTKVPLVLCKSSNHHCVVLLVVARRTLMSLLSLLSLLPLLPLLPLMSLLSLLVVVLVVLL